MVFTRARIGKFVSNKFLIRSICAGGVPSGTVTSRTSPGSTRSRWTYSTSIFSDMWPPMSRPGAWEPRASGLCESGQGDLSDARERHCYRHVICRVRVVEVHAVLVGDEARRGHHQRAGRCEVRAQQRAVVSVRGVFGQVEARLRAAHGFQLDGDLIVAQINPQLREDLLHL